MRVERDITIGLPLLFFLLYLSADFWKPHPTKSDLAVSFEPSKNDLPIIDRPIVFDQERKDLTLAYRRQHQDPKATDIIIAPKMIILHHTAINTFDATWKYFNNVRAEAARTQLASAGDVNVSAHFVVDRDGTIYRLMPETWMARHSIGLNHVAIGIENVGDGDKFPLTDAQVEANIALVRYLKGKYPAIEYLIGHHEYRKMEKMEGTPLFLELDPKYRNQKPDPGPAFMEKVRERVKDLELKGPPAKVTTQSFISNSSVNDGLFRHRQAIRFHGKVSAGESYRQDIGNGLSFWLSENTRGWTIEVCSSSENPCGNEYVWVVNLPYRSSNSRNIDASYWQLPEAATNWSPRVFNFVLNASDYAKANRLVDRLIMSKPKGVTYTAGDSAKDFSELKGIIARAGEGNLRIDDFKMVGEKILELEFRVDLRLPCNFRSLRSKELEVIPCEEPPAKDSKLKGEAAPAIVRPF
ncbi:MAG TPA: peptidoglycan recognition family protein [Terriglobales bacterium]|nr:peptidoglycan recognition family protein [Terriglobales bacterium]